MVKTKKATSGRSSSSIIKKNYLLPLLYFLTGAILSHAWNFSRQSPPPLIIPASTSITSEFSSTSTSTSTSSSSSSTTQSTTSSTSRTTGTMTFLEAAISTDTDKVQGTRAMPGCLLDRDKCDRPTAINPSCQVVGHHYDSMYQRWLGRLSRRSSSSSNDVQPFQFVEIGFYHGSGRDAFEQFLSPNAEVHSLDISCLPVGPVEEGLWPWGNFALKHKRYQQLLDSHRLHCGDATKYEFLHKTWTTYMKRIDDNNEDGIPTAPPLMVVVDDASHLAEHMVISVFFWLPRLEPGGLLFIEDVEPNTEANAFRTDFLPQLMKDMHYCGLPPNPNEHNNDSKLCFPTIQPYLKSISCELHICVLERNDVPAVGIEYDEAASMPPAHALRADLCAG